MKKVVGLVKRRAHFSKASAKKGNISEKAISQIELIKRYILKTPRTMKYRNKEREL
jgi:hypothetical protein